MNVKANIQWLSYSDKLTIVKLVCSFLACAHSDIFLRIIKHDSYGQIVKTGIDISCQLYAEMNLAEMPLEFGIHAVAAYESLFSSQTLQPFFKAKSRALNSNIV